MKLVDIMNIAAAGYDSWDDVLLSCFDAETGKPVANPDHGDGLAEFVAQELFETFEEEADDDEQLARSSAVVETAIEDLQKILDAFDDKRQALQLKTSEKTA